MDVGTDLFAMMQAGASMQGFRVGTAGYLMVGERITETIFGEAIRGTIIIYIMLIFRETGGPGIIPVIGIDRNIENLHITMMEGFTVGVNRIGVILIKDVVKVTLARGLPVLDRVKLARGLQVLDRGTLAKVPHKEILTKVPQVLDRGTLTKAVPYREILTKVVPQLGKDTLEQVDRVLQVRTSIAQVKPIEVNILPRQKERVNKV